MGLFSIRKPRGSRHEYIYADDRKQRLKAVEERAKAELGMPAAERPDAERIRGMFIGATRHARRRRERRLSGGFVLSYGIIVVLLVILVAVWKMLLSM